MKLGLLMAMPALVLPVAPEPGGRRAAPPVGRRVRAGGAALELRQDHLGARIHAGVQKVFRILERGAQPDAPCRGIEIGIDGADSSCC